MRILGIDLATRAKHRAIIANEQGHFIGSVIKFRSRLPDLKRLYAQSRQGMESNEPLVVVMEATDIVWYPVSVYFERQGATVHVVNPRMSADLARFYNRHASSDRLAARTLARLPVVLPDELYPLVLSGADYLTLQRGCKELDRLVTQTSAIKNRLQSIDHLGWPDLKLRVFPKPLGSPARWFRDHFYEPRRVIEAGGSGLRQDWRAAEDAYNGDEDWIEPLVALAREMVGLYGDQGVYLDYPALAAAVQREQRRLVGLEDDAHYVRLNVTRPLYRKLHSSRNVETIRGVGQDSGAVYVGFIGLPDRFPNNRRFRSWHGIIPRSAQSGESESKGMQVTKAGPNTVKKYGFLNADVARQWDPQIASVYHDQMVNKGKHHTQAVCACATHLLDRVRVILLEDRPYELRDADGAPVTRKKAREIVLERYTVPDQVRRRNNKRSRKERTARRAERKHNRRRSHSR